MPTDWVIEDALPPRLDSMEETSPEFKSQLFYSNRRRMQPPQSESRL